MPRPLPRPARPAQPPPAAAAAAAGPSGHPPRGETRVELETKVRDDFTITEKAPTRAVIVKAMQLYIHYRYRGGSQQPHRQPEGPHPGHDGLLQRAGRGGEHGEGGGRRPGARNIRGVIEAHVGLD